MNKARLLRDLIVLLPIGLLVWWVIGGDDSSHVILYGSTIILLAVGMAHAIRKLIFPYIDVKELIEKVKENSIACAMVVLGMIWLLGQIIQAFVVLLH